MVDSLTDLPFCILVGNLKYSEYILILNLSGSQDVFDTILGPLEAPPPKPKRDAVPPPKLKLTSPIMITKPQEEKQIVQVHSGTHLE